MTMEWLFQPWPWFIAGPIIGLFVPALLLAGNKPFGVASNLRHLCSVLAPGRIEFFRYDWRTLGGWNLSFLSGIVLGAFVAVTWMGSGDVALSEHTREALTALGLHDLTGLVPREVFSWPALLTVKGFVSIVIGGVLVGFGATYAGGCTSGHAITGLADLQVPSLLAVAGFFAGGLVATHWILPLLFRW